MTGENNSRPVKAAPEMLKAVACPFCERKVARRELKLKRASLTTESESVEVSVVTKEVSRIVWMPVREKSFCPKDWFCDST